MNCPYCNSEINNQALFCDKCGQTLHNENYSSYKTDAFWSKEKANRQRDIINQFATLKQKANDTHQAIIQGKKLKSKKVFFRTMLFLFVISAVTCAIAAYKAYEVEDETSIIVFISSLITACFIIIITTLSNMVSEGGAESLLYPLIPLYGCYYLFLSIILAIINFFAPLNKNEKALVKDLKHKNLELKSLKKDETNLLNEYKLLGGDVHKNLPPQISQNLISPVNNKFNGWQVTTAIMTIIVIATFVISLYFAPIIYQYIN